jgi:hypothetical protein
MKGLCGALVFLLHLGAIRLDHAYRLKKTSQSSESAAGLFFLVHISATSLFVALMSYDYHFIHRIVKRCARMAGSHSLRAFLPRR